MKQNGNNGIAGNYYLGLDVGTNSIGWAATDKDYNVLKFKGNAMWGIRLFDEAQGAEGRRTSRTARRRLNRRKQRLRILELLFAEEIAKKDPAFFVRLHESDLWFEDKSEDGKYSLFNDKYFTDKDYHLRYPTIYHLRAELLNSTEEHDIRLVFLAIHSIMKSRGHFLYADSGNDGEVLTVSAALRNLSSYLSSEYDISYEPEDYAAFCSTLSAVNIGVTNKKKLLRAALNAEQDNNGLSLNAITDMLAGATVKFSDLYCDEELKSAEIKSFCLKNSIDDSFDQLSEILGDRIEVLLQLKTVFDAARLSGMLGNHKYISEAKVELYDKNYKDLRLFKKYIREAVPEQYKHIFSEKKTGLNNYAAYSGYKTRSGEYTCSIEDFCKFLLSAVPEPVEAEADIKRIFSEIKEHTFLTKLKGTENGVIPYQLHKRELTGILNNASAYLPFLNEKDCDGISVKDKVIKTFEFRIPYYVGPLNSKSPNYWAVRFAGAENEKIYPWNFEKVIDTASSAEGFINNLIGRCTYTGERVLPKDSLLYSEFSLLNEINPLRVNGQPLPHDVKQKLITDLFYESRKKVSKKSISEYLRANGYTKKTDEISGIDDTVKTTMKSYHDFKYILNKTGDRQLVETIIRGVLVFGEDKKMLRRWLKANTHGLNEQDFAYICRLKYSDWGRLSEVFLMGIYSVDEFGEAKTIMDCLRETDCNLMQLLSSNYSFAEEAEKYRNELFGNGQSLSEKLDSMYVAPAVRRSLRQTLRIVDEIVDARKSVPEKIFIEMARGSAQEMKNKRTESRKDKLIDLYKACHEDSSELFKRLENEDENRLRSDKLYLYYTQMGKCMYSGDDIDFESLLAGELYDIDHIFPRSKVKDNSLDNRVLVKNILNREKTNIYPIDEAIRSKMRPTWETLKKQKLISDTKFERLVRSYPLTDKELSDFVARQLVETQQSTKALATLLKDMYGDKTRIVYSKAGNVSDFRQQFDLVKCREVNDLHHAKDAYLNIVVGNVYCTKFTDRFFANIRSENYSLNKVFEFNVPGAWDKDNTIKIVKRYMVKNNILFTRMPHEVKGQIFDLQIMPAGKGQLEKKRGLDIDRYGGYNKITGAYYCLVEHTVKKKRIRTIEPVFLYAKDFYERSPEAYCQAVHGLEAPKIIAKKIGFDSLLELNGQRFTISGRTGNKLIFINTYQLVVGEEWERYIKNLQKYSDRCAARKAELPVTDFDGISAEKNEELYSLFVNKCSAKAYCSFLSNMKADMEENCEKFCKMSIMKQTNILLEALKAFKCGKQNTDFSELCGKKTVGRIAKSNNISTLETAYLINQSVTGLYETKLNLLG